MIRYDAVTDTWCAPLKLDPKDIGNINQVAVDRAGNAVVVWLGRDGMKSFRFRIATGRWSPTQTIQKIDNVLTTRPSVAVSRTGYAMVTWGQRGVGTVVSRFNAYTNTWTPVRFLEKAPANQDEAIYDIQDALIAVDDAGNATPAWFRWDESVYNSVHRISASRYNVATNSWSAPRTMSAPNTFVEQLSVAMDRLGNGFVMWGSNGMNGWAVSHVARYVAQTSQWQQSAVVQDDPAAMTLSSNIVAGPNGSAVAIWSEEIDIANSRYAVRVDQLGPIGH